MARPDIEALTTINQMAVFQTIEAAKILGVTRQGILQMIKRKKIKAVKIAGTWHIKGSELFGLLLD